MSLRPGLLALALVSALLTPAALEAQVTPEDPPDATSLRVFLDCQTWNCREDRIRQEILWVTWVREPQDAQLFIIMTGQRAGAGFQYAFDFEGRGPLAELEDSYRFTSSTTDVEEEVVQGLVQTLSLGLVRFVAQGGFADLVEITGTAPDEAAVAGGGTDRQQQEDDPWNFWVFSLRANTEFEREDRESQDRINLRASANRTTDAWKIDVNGRIDFFRREVTFEDGDGFLDQRNDWSASTLVVKSLSDHWSVGFRGSTGAEVRTNNLFSWAFEPAVEWNYFPWQESSRRRFVVLYSAGVRFQDYDEVTVFNKSAETLFSHQLDVQFRAQEPWGNARFGTEFDQYLEFLDQYSFQVNGAINYRVFRGLGVELEANYQVIQNQRFISGEGLTPEEILTSRRALATGSRFSVELGVSFNFGSIFNNVVNARFPALGGDGFR